MKNKFFMSTNKQRVKLYKKGKIWVASLVTLFSVGLGISISDVSVHADTATSTSNSNTSQPSASTSSSNTSQPSASASTSSSNTSQPSTSATGQPAINTSGNIAKTNAYDNMTGDNNNGFTGVSANVSGSRFNGGEYKENLSSGSAPITVTITDMDVDSGNTITGTDGSSTGNSQATPINSPFTFNIVDGQVEYKGVLGDSTKGLMSDIIADIKNNWSNGYKPLFTFKPDSSFSDNLNGYSGTIDVTLNYTHQAIDASTTVTSKRNIDAFYNDGEPAKVFDGNSEYTQSVSYKSNSVVDCVNSQTTNPTYTPNTQTMPSYDVPQIPGFKTTIFYPTESASTGSSGSGSQSGNSTSITTHSGVNDSTTVKAVDGVKPNTLLPSVRVTYTPEESSGIIPKGSNPNASVSGDNVNNGGTYQFDPLVPNDSNKASITINFVDPNSNRVITDDNGTISTSQSANSISKLWSQTFQGTQLNPQQVAQLIQPEIQQLWNEGYKPLFTVSSNANALNDDLSKVTGNLTLTLNFTHRVAPKTVGSSSIKRTINYVYSDTDEQAAPSVTQNVTFNKTQLADMVNGTIISNSPVTISPDAAQFDPIASPNIAGYVPSATESTLVNLTSADIDDPAGKFDETIYYSKTNTNNSTNTNANNNSANSSNNSTNNDIYHSSDVNNTSVNSDNDVAESHFVNNNVLYNQSKNYEYSQNSNLGSKKDYENNIKLEKNAVLPSTGENNFLALIDLLIGFLMSGVLSLFGLKKNRHKN